ncbi:MAG: hypothetical protein R3324_19010, partial [Halobacteriales archaeon]|nr:hypothetical protein [Halobacteriales archaeon]
MALVDHQGGRIPLVARAIYLMRVATENVVVDTDSPEIAAVARMFGADVMGRDSVDAGDDVTLDDYLERTYLTRDTEILVIQPTMAASLERHDIASFVARCHDLGVPSVAMTQNTHIMWVEGERHHDAEQELGVRWYSPGATKGAPAWKVNMFAASDPVAVDIDTPTDLIAARSHQSIRSINLVARAGDRTGSGHLRRMLQLASELQHHDILWTLWGDDVTGPAPPWARSMVATTNLHDTLRWADLYVFDVLDTTNEMVATALARSAKVITLEDLGPGSELADLTINAMYPSSRARNLRIGGEWAVMRPEFHAAREQDYTPDVEEPQILITFGGSDPAELTEMIARDLSGWG